MLVIGVDAASHNIIEPNHDSLPNMSRLMGEGSYMRIKLEEPPLSAPLWCSMFSGKTPDEHRHTNFVIKGAVQKRSNIKVEFIWDVLHKQGVDVRVLQVPFVYPPYNFRCDFLPIKNGLSTELADMERDMDRITEKSLEVLRQNPDLFIVVYNMLDKLSHFHWGEPMILDWYMKIDNIIGRLVKHDEKIIIVSDHGFCSWDESNTHTLPRKNAHGRKIRGDHSDTSVAILRGLEYDIRRPQDIFFAIKKEFVR
jgi:predicted AlkP superfamily phosphohydrolase/phosphomutase